MNRSSKWEKNIYTVYKQKGKTESTQIQSEDAFFTGYL